MPLSLQRTSEGPESLHARAHAEAERRLARLGLRRARIHLEGRTARIEGDVRDLWRVVAQRDEVVACLADLGVVRVTLDLDGPAGSGGVMARLLTGSA